MTYVPYRLNAVRSDCTAHRWRLARLLPRLAEEFDGVRTPAEIRTCADAILAEYRDAPVRSYVLTIAHTRARQCLKAETCDVLATSGAGAPAR